MLRISLLTVSVVLLLGFIIILTGYSADEKYEGSITETFGEKRLVVWQNLLNVDLIPRIKRDVEEVEILSNRRGFISWKEDLGNGDFRIYSMIEKIEPTKLVIELKESTNGLTGTWTYLLEDTDSGTKLTISEESELTNIVSRGLQTFQGRNVNLVKAMKSVRVGLFQLLLHSP